MRTPEAVIEAVAAVTGVRAVWLLGPSRRRRIVRIRHAAMWLVAFWTRSSLTDIGACFNRDHTTVLYGIRSFQRRATGHPQFPWLLARVNERLTHQTWHAG